MGDHNHWVSYTTRFITRRGRGGKISEHLQCVCVQCGQVFHENEVTEADTLNTTPIENKKIEF